MYMNTVCTHTSQNTSQKYVSTTGKFTYILLRELCIGKKKKSDLSIVNMEMFSKIQFLTIAYNSKSCYLDMTTYSAAVSMQ